MANNKRLKALLNDPRGSISWTLNESLYWGVNQFLSTRWCHMTAWLWGVKLGRNIHFKGLTRFQRFPNSIISIGDGCTFLSTTNANPLGLSIPCMVATWRSPGERAEVTIGKNCGFSGTMVGGILSVTLGDNVLCGPNTRIFDTDGHGFGDRRMMQAEPVVIEDNVWLGMNCMVLKGVTIGHHTIVGANSIVTQSLPPNVVAAGTPARVIRHLDEQTGK